MRRLSGRAGAPVNAPLNIADSPAQEPDEQQMSAALMLVGMGAQIALPGLRRRKTLGDFMENRICMLLLDVAGRQFLIPSIASYPGRDLYGP